MEWNSLIEEVDKQGELKYMRALPKQLMEGALLAAKLKFKKKKFANIVICVMGGSGIGGAVLKNLLKKELKIPLDTVSDYELPAFVGKNSLVFTVSYSGNTEETVSCFQEAKRKKATAIAITTGGLLAKIDKHAIIVPKAVPQPRLGFAYLFTPMLLALGKIGLITDKKKELNEAIHSLEKNRQRIEEEAMRLATELQGKIPVIYAQAEFSTIAYRFCTEINENSKQFCHSQVFPEMNHNEINATHGAENLVLVLLRDRKERPKIAERFEISKQIWGEKFKIIETFVEGNSLLARMLFAIWLESLTAYYLSLLNREDPMRIPSIDFLKSAIKEKKG